jgi:hypothetical protein
MRSQQHQIWAATRRLDNSVPLLSRQILRWVNFADKCHACISMTAVNTVHFCVRSTAGFGNSSDPILNQEPLAGIKNDSNAAGDVKN